MITLLAIVYTIGVIITSILRARVEVGKRYAEGPFIRGFEAVLWPLWVPLWLVGLFGEIIWGLM